MLCSKGVFSGSSLKFQVSACSFTAVCAEKLANFPLWFWFSVNLANFATVSVSLEIKSSWGSWCWGGTFGQVLLSSAPHRPGSIPRSPTPFPGLITFAVVTVAVSLVPCDPPGLTVEGQRSQVSSAVSSPPARAPCRILSRCAFLKPSYP